MSDHDKTIGWIYALVVVANFLPLLKTKSFVEIEGIRVRRLDMQIYFFNTAILVRFIHRSSQKFCSDPTGAVWSQNSKRHDVQPTLLTLFLDSATYCPNQYVC